MLLEYLDQVPSYWMKGMRCYRKLKFLWPNQEWMVRINVKRKKSQQKIKQLSKQDKFIDQN